ncbi:MAG: hypothetical protein GXP01_02885 [Alphaproteobacteria bacterium]|nr:hypothetical protein [Alphaproteobacteria bacterium]
MAFVFAPDPARGARLDRGMRHALADSLAHIAEQVGTEPGWAADSLEDQITTLRQRRFGPVIFALYYDLVPAIEAGDPGLAQTLVDRICAQKPLSELFSVGGIEDGAVGENAALYRDKLDTDPKTAFRFLQPSPDELTRARTNLHLALERFEPALADSFGELRAMISQIIFAKGEPGSPYQFGGGSSYMLWGALMINATGHDNELEMAISLMHEAAHTLLFGATIVEPLLYNGDDELYSSPLRQDPRPMDGIYHATFVSARMHHALAGLLASDVLTPQEKSEAAGGLQVDKQAFFSGLEVVRAHGRLSETGAEIIDAAEAYMRTT